jgi:type IV pilus assembly protein PilX
MNRSLSIVNRQPAFRGSQAGATLIVGLVLLLVLTVLGVSGMNTATMEVTMAGNLQFQQDAFQMAEDGIDIALAQRNYTTDADRTIPWIGDPNRDRNSVARYVGNTSVPDAAFSVEYEAFHFDVTSVGRGPRNATSTHTQSFYVIGQAL